MRVYHSYSAISVTAIQNGKSIVFSASILSINFTDISINSNCINLKVKQYILCTIFIDFFLKCIISILP